MGKYFNFILTGFALLSLWLVWTFVLDFSYEKSANPKNPDAFVNNLGVTVMNDEGEREYQFSSPHMLHYAEKDRTVFALPYLLMFQKDTPPWEVKAQNGEALEGNKQINLINNVTMTQASTKIQTSQLAIFPRERVATTDQFISAVQPNANIKSVGMKVNLIDQTLNLLSHVDGVYLQAKKPPVHIVSQTGYFNRKTNVGIFENQVKLTQGTSNLDTPKLTLYMNNNNDLLKAVADGPGTTYQSVPDPKKPPFVATAKEMRYFPPQSEVWLIGDAKATQGPNSYQAPEIHYHIDQEMVVSHQRTTIVLQPKTLKRDS